MDELKNRYKKYMLPQPEILNMGGCNIGRGNSFKTALQYLSYMRKLLKKEQINILETGTIRGIGGPVGDGYSTIAWGWYSKNYPQVKVYTCDISAEHINDLRNMKEEFSENIQYINRD